MKHGSHVTGLVCGLMLASLMGSFSADAAGIAWGASEGGDLALPGNWTGGVRPGTSDNARFRKNVTGAYTLSEDMTVAGVEVGSASHPDISAVFYLRLGSLNGSGLTVVNGGTMILSSGSIGITGTSYIGLLKGSLW